MVSRVVLGCDALGQRLVRALAERDGVDAVVCESETRVDALAGDDVQPRVGDPTDPAVLRALPECEVVVVTTADTARNADICTAARDRYPEAFVISYAGRDGTAADRDRLSAVADVVVDPHPAFLESVTDKVVGDRAEDTRKLREVLRSIDGTIAVVMHDNPDPDAIASAVALSTLAERLGATAEPCYYGDISHQENRAMVNLLELELTNLDPEADVRSRFAGFALVDHSRPGVNDGLPVDMDVDVVIDHHPPRGAVPGAYTDLRADVGATSTLVIDHFHRYGLTPSTAVATALMYGIQIDTDGFTREVSTLDFEAAASILPHVDVDVLERVESPSVSGDTMSTVADAIENRTVRGSVLVSCAGYINDRDALPQAADRLLTMEGISTVLVYGLLDDQIIMSARARGADVDLGETLRVAFDHIGSAGGHADMAGAQIPITDAFGEFEDDDDKLAVVADLVTETFYDTLQDRPSSDAGGDVDADAIRFGFDPLVELED